MWPRGHQARRQTHGGLMSTMWMTRSWRTALRPPARRRWRQGTPYWTQACLQPPPLARCPCQQVHQVTEPPALSVCPGMPFPPVPSWTVLRRPCSVPGVPFPAHVPEWVQGQGLCSTALLCLSVHTSFRSEHKKHLSLSVSQISMRLRNMRRCFTLAGSPSRTEDEVGPGRVSSLEEDERDELSPLPPPGCPRAGEHWFCRGDHSSPLLPRPVHLLTLLVMAPANPALSSSLSLMSTI
jgi:hypothetical protein